MMRIAVPASLVFAFFLATAFHAARGQSPQQADAITPLSPGKKLDFFPVTTQFSPVASGQGWRGQSGPVNEQTIRETIDNYLAGTSQSPQKNAEARNPRNMPQLRQTTLQ